MAGRPSAFRGHPKSHQGIELPSVRLCHRDHSLGDEIQQLDTLAQTRQLCVVRPSRPEPSGAERAPQTFGFSVIWLTRVTWRSSIGPNARRSNGYLAR
jgi:hypothetical protein